MAGWHHRLNGHGFEQTGGDSEGQGSLECCSPWVTKSRTHLSNWTTTTFTNKNLKTNSLRSPWGTILGSPLATQQQQGSIHAREGAVSFWGQKWDILWAFSAHGNSIPWDLYWWCEWCWVYLTSWSKSNSFCLTALLVFCPFQFVSADLD